MKHYPSIDLEVRKKIPIYAFEKLDGSSCCAEYSRKAGWYKFGTRKRLLGDDDRQGKANKLFLDKYGDALAAVIKKQQWDRCLAYYEMWGPKSCFGQHELQDDHTVTLFDFSVHKKGILPPKEFLDTFGHLDHAKLLYRGNVTEEFVQQVKTGTLEGMPCEGVVCKGALISPGRPLMFKIKSDIWIQKLKDYCADNIKLFNELM